jgi:Beta-galactosidase jelly roll domain
MRVGEKEKMLLVDQRLQIILLPRALALRTWIANSPVTVGAPQTENDKRSQVPLISDAALMRASAKNETGIWADLEFSAGEHEIRCLAPSRPAKCFVNGKATHSDYDSQWRTVQTQTTTPALPAQPIEIKEVDHWVERFDTTVGHWLTTDLRALEELGPIPYGYVKYRGQFDSSAEQKLAVSLFADDAAKIFLNGKVLGEMPRAKRQAEFDLAGSVVQGANTLEIAYELFGSPNFGEHIGELKGIESVALLGRNGAAGKGGFGRWQVQTVPAAMRGRQIDPVFSIGAWQKLALGAKSTSARVPAFTWCRAEFVMESAPPGWQIPWRAHFEADCDALLYLNGKFVGRYMTIGPQKKFFLPDSYLKYRKQGTNNFTIVLAYTADVTPIRTLRIEPYEEFATCRTRIEFGW